MTLAKLPISPLKSEAPIIPMDRWELKGDPQALVKKFTFRRMTDRTLFINQVLLYEEETNHNATIVIDGENVYVRVLTKHLDQVTEVDREYASFVDSAFKDVVYNH